MNSQQSQTINAALAKYKGREFANRTLAREIVRENPGLFDSGDVDRVRSAIRRLRGAHGKKNRNQAIPDFIRAEQKPSEYMEQFLCKAEDKAPREWWLPDEIRKPLVLSDLHIPYHERDAIMVALDHGFKSECDAIYINGDLIDFADISRWGKDPRKKRVAVELDMVDDFLRGLVKLGLPVFWKMGNHEERWNRHLLDNAPALSDIEAFQISRVLDLEELDIETIGPRQRARFGSLIVIHGHEFGQSFFNPVNPARGLFLRAKTSAMAGHNHQSSKHSESNLNGKAMSCFSTGCLCDMAPEYSPFAYAKWNHGAAIVEVDGDWFNVENFEIIEGRVVR
jgi:predicted phosphodiesterase